MHSAGFQVSSYELSKLFEYCRVSLPDLAGKCCGDLSHVLLYFFCSYVSIIFTKTQNF